MSVSEVAEREYEELKNSLLNFLKTRRNHCSFAELEAWSQERTLPKLTLRIAINDLIESGDILGSPNLVEGDDFAPWVKIPPLRELVGIYERAAAPVRPTRVLGICLNTFDLSEQEAGAAVARAALETGLPVTDPVRFDPGPVVEAIVRAAR